MFCNNCNKEIPNSSSECPYCGFENEVKNKDKKVSAIIIFAVIVITLICLLVIVRSVSENKTDTEPLTSSESAVIENTESTSPTKIYKDENVKVSFVNITESSMSNEFLNLQLLIENKSDKTFAVALKDTFVNDKTAKIVSNLPMIIAPTESSEQPFALFKAGTDINQVKDIKKLKFKIYLINSENMSDSHETKSIEITF